MGSALRCTLLAAVPASGVTTVVFGAVAVSLIVSVAFLLTRGSGGGGSLYDQIGSGGISREGDWDSAAGPGYGGEAGGVAGAGGSAEQEQEVRQMLNARNERRMRNGQEPIDVEAEVARLLAPAGGEGGSDPGLVEEVRQMVLARNERRVRQGEQPLDVEAEIARTLQELGG